MIRSLKEIRKEANARSKQDGVERDEEGRVIIDVTVRSDEAFLSDYSVDKPVISSDFADFLHDRLEPIPPREPLLLRIHGDCIDEDEKPLYESALREHALESYKKTATGFRRNTLLSSVMFAIGVLGIIAAVLCSVFPTNAVFTEILDIFAWVFVWEAVDLFFLERGGLRAERRRALRLYDAKIQFLPLTAEPQN